VNRRSTTWSLKSGQKESKTGPVKNGGWGLRLFGVWGDFSEWHWEGVNSVYQTGVGTGNEMDYDVGTREKGQGWGSKKKKKGLTPISVISTETRGKKGGIERVGKLKKITGREKKKTWVCPGRWLVPASGLVESLVRVRPKRRKSGRPKGNWVSHRKRRGKREKLQPAQKE